MNSLRKYREEAHITQEELSERSGVSRSTIIALENEPNKEVSTRTLKALANALNTSISELFFSDEC